ncbi:DUF1642 domain-containing protein [Lacticaseibacillus paracasei]|uniref:DUF1642 domain-containing protein n=1 Tax=Lacticaseibacillus paracasei TaxID=1597 RepID=UPI0031F689C5
MSEEKLYAVKNDEGEWLDQDRLWGPGTWATPDKDEREKVAKCYGGHVVTLVEEPKKVVLTKEQAEIVEVAHDDYFPASYISGNSGEDEELLMNAYVNGYTVAKEKKYGVWVPHVKGKMYYKEGRGSDDLDIASADCLNDKNQQFTFTEIEHYGLQDCEKEEVNDDEQ